MRTFAAILLLVIFAFNWFGYQLLSSYMQDRVTSRLDRKLDRAEYAEGDLLEIKLAFSAPYQISQPDFERCYGEIEISGIHYTYVKRKFYNDSLTLLCLPNQEKTDIVNAKNSFYKLVNGLEAGATEKNTGKGNSPLYKNILAEFIAPESKLPCRSTIPEVANAYPEKEMAFYLSYKKHLPERPPEHWTASILG